ncbi:lipoprotein [Vibrio orientalis CIP 102891 = ATCC 33934]|uniref:Lipoprotein n=1 Tax=Vibrio orientalis CIP 102891 = ATCC 33934 TaxID=675816 RepID=C9QE61_VIBOR|nr:DUF4382 domain-containing protein [Vibrio orientalis]EEX94246.1 putative lipoprotein [Vibrio orientalis CIP 102891 = ATCC 33934]EGU54209.1 lipoprotein [Vibrio orientalis CIP 102891 = ATCC 33934]
MKLIKIGLLSASVALVLSGCNSGDSSTDTTPVTLSVSDAPIDNVSEVVVTYSKVAFLPLGEGSPILFDVYKKDNEGNLIDDNGNPLPDGQDPIPLSVNLLNFQGGEAQELIENQNIPTGDYKLCLFANDGDHPTFPSYVVEANTGNSTPLTVKGEGKCPQGVGSVDNAGVLYFNDTFTVNHENNDYVVEFDLRRGLKEPKNSSNAYTIQRTSVSLVNTAETGEISGNVADSTMGACENTTSSPSYSHAVYLYEGDVTQAEMGSFSGSGTVAPITAANVTLDDDGVTHEYEFGFVKPGTYSVGYTCTANNDSEEGLTGNFIIHAADSGLSVTEDTETRVHF